MTFDEYAARKEADARSARVEPFATDADLAGAGDYRALGNEWTRALFDGPFYVSPQRGDTPSTSLVFVQSRNGNTVASDPATLGGGDTDKHVIYEGLSRVAADAVLAGAATVGRGEVVFSTWHPEITRLRVALGLPRHPMQVIATLRGMDLESGILFNTPDLRVILLATPDAIGKMRLALQARPWIHALPLRDASDLRTLFVQLRRLGVNTMSCVGGRTLAAQLIDAGLVQDLYLTTSAKDAGEPNTPMYPKPLPGEIIVTKHGTGVDTGVVFQHVALNTSHAG